MKPTVKAAVIFRVRSRTSRRRLPTGGRKAKAAKKTANGNGNGNGHGQRLRSRPRQLPFIPNIDDVWSHLSDDERETFVRGHAPSIWSAFDPITA